MAVAVAVAVNIAIAVAVAVTVAVAVGRVICIRAWGRAVLVLFRGRHGVFGLYCSRREGQRRKEFKIVWNDYVGEVLEQRRLKLIDFKPRRIFNLGRDVELGMRDMAETSRRGSSVI